MTTQSPKTKPLDITKSLCTRDARPAQILRKCDTTHGRRRVECFKISVPNANYPQKNDILTCTIEGMWYLDGRHSVNDVVIEMPWHLWLRDMQEGYLKNRKGM